MRCEFSDIVGNLTTFQIPTHPLVEKDIPQIPPKPLTQDSNSVRSGFRYFCHWKKVCNCLSNVPPRLNKVLSYHVPPKPLKFPSDPHSVINAPRKTSQFLLTTENPIPGNIVMNLLCACCSANISLLQSGDRISK